MNNIQYFELDVEFWPSEVMCNVQADGIIIKTLLKTIENNV